MDNYDTNKLYYNFCEACLNHRKYAEKLMPNDEIYNCVYRVGRQFPNDAAMLKSFMPVLDMFEDFVTGTKNPINIRNMFICGSVYASLFFIGFAIRLTELHEVRVYIDALTRCLYDVYHPSDGRFVDDPNGLVGLIDKFKEEVELVYADGPFPNYISEYEAIRVSYTAVASAIITNLPAYVPDYEDMQRAGDIIIRRNARLCRTRRKHHDAAEIITRNNLWRIQRIVEDDNHESDQLQ